MANIVFGGVLGSTRIERVQECLLEGLDIGAFLEKVVLVEYVAEEVPIIENVHQLFEQRLRENFAPVRIVRPKGDIEGQQVLYLLAV